MKTSKYAIALDLIREKLAEDYTLNVVNVFTKETVLSNTKANVYTNIISDDVAEDLVEYSYTPGLRKLRIGCYAIQKNPLDSQELGTAAIAHGILAEKIDKVMDSIVGSRQQKTQSGHTQQRTDVDFRSVAPNGVRLRDMLETDLELMMANRANSTSGQAALARMGIPDKVAYERIKKAILDEQQARGKKIARPDRTLGDKVDDLIDREPEVTPELLDAIHGYFSGMRPGAGQGMDATIQRIKKLTRLSLMNQLGLPSTSTVTCGSPLLSRRL